MNKFILFFLTCALCSFPNLYAQNINTIAGNGTMSYTGDGGPATAATLGYSAGDVAMDKKGNIYIADKYNDVVRKIDRAGKITAIAGGGTGIGDRGPATAAFIQPTCIAISNTDELYLFDQWYRLARKVDAAGNIITIAGGATLVPGDGMPATAVGLAQCVGITVDPTGNVYLTQEEVIRKVNTLGIISTIAGKIGGGHTGDGIPATDARFLGATGIVSDHAGNLFFTDYKNHEVRKINAAGIISTLAGDGSLIGHYTGDGGPATAAQLDNPTGLGIDGAGNLYISDEHVNRLRKIDAATGIIDFVTGNGVTGFGGDGGPATACKLSGPRGLALDCANNIYICDVNNFRVRKTGDIQYMNFVPGSTSMTACANTATSVDALLSADTKSSGQPIDWTVYTAPTQGAISGLYNTTTTGSPLTPTGMKYTSVPGYVGLDSFTILVGDCPQIGDTRKIYVTVKPLPAVAAITGADSVCKGRSTTLSNPTAGGTWTVSNTAATVSGSVVTGVTAGTMTVSYTVTALGCTNTATYAMRVKNCTTGIASPRPSPKEREVLTYPNPAGNIVYISGLTGNTTYKLMSMVGSVIKEGSVSEVNNSIDMKGMASGMYMISLSPTLSEGKGGVANVVRRIVKR